MIQITTIPCLTDNYAYIINDESSGVVGVVDPSEAKPIVSYLNKNKLKLNYILNTHHHYDHIGGNIELKKIYNSKVVGFEGDKHRIPGINITLKNDESWKFGNSLVKSLSGRLKTHQACAKGLGIKKIHKTIEVNDTPENRGMINKINYLLKIEK